MFRILSASAAFLAIWGSAHAGSVIEPPIASTISSTETRAFAGLNWTFGSDGGKSEAVAGVARVKTDNGGDSKGAKLSVHLPIGESGLGFGKVKLAGMKGQNDAMAELGFGYGGSGFFGTAGLWAPYVNFGADVGFSGTFEGYLGIHSLDAWDVPSEAVPVR